MSINIEAQTFVYPSQPAAEFTFVDVNVKFSTKLILEVYWRRTFSPETTPSSFIFDKQVLRKYSPRRRGCRDEPSIFTELTSHTSVPQRKKSPFFLFKVQRLKNTTTWVYFSLRHQGLFFFFVSCSGLSICGAAARDVQTWLDNSNIKEAHSWFEDPPVGLGLLHLKRLNISG